MGISRFALLVVLSALTLGCGRPLQETPICTSGNDCQTGEWCVFAWWSEAGKAREPAPSFCLDACTKDSECESGCCSALGDAAAPGRVVVLSQPHACAPVGMCP